MTNGMTKEVLDLIVESTERIITKGFAEITGKFEKDLLEFVESVDGKLVEIRTLLDERDATTRSLSEEIAGSSLLFVDETKRLQCMVEGLEDNLQEGVVSLKATQGEMFKLSSDKLENVELALRVDIEGTQDQIDALGEQFKDFREETEEDTQSLVTGAVTLLRGEIDENTAVIVGKQRENEDATRLHVSRELGRLYESNRTNRAKDYARVLERLSEFSHLPDVKGLRDWDPEDTYDLGTNVRHRGGIWHSLQSTDESPGTDCLDWVCLSAGIDHVEVLEQHPNGVRAEVGVYDSLGKVHRLKFELPGVNRIAGSWEDSGTYRQLDSVMYDGVRWIATCDNPDGKPGDSKDWVVESMRGPQGSRGLKGPIGPIGEPGPAGEVPLDSIVERIKASEEVGNIRRWKGFWEPGIEYRTGDLVKRDTVLYLATKDNNSDPYDTVLGAWEYITGADS